MITTVIFDFDGTLFDTRQANCLAYQEAFRRCGLRLSRDAYYGFFGKKWSDWGPSLAGKRAQRIHAIKQAIYPSYLDHIQPMRAYTVLVETFRHTHTTVLATNASEACVRAVLAQYELNFIKEFYGVDFPDRRCMLQHILADMSIEASQALMFDDSPDNIAIARSLGILTHHVRPLTISAEEQHPFGSI